MDVCLHQVSTPFVWVVGRTRLSCPCHAGIHESDEKWSCSDRPAVKSTDANSGERNSLEDEIHRENGNFLWLKQHPPSRKKRWLSRQPQSSRKLPSSSPFSYWQRRRNAQRTSGECPAKCYVSFQNDSAWDHRDHGRLCFVEDRRRS